MRTKASDWYSDVREFRQLCGDARSLARGERAEEFTHKMMLQANAYGLDTYISTDQLRWLCDIADHEIPQRRS